MLYFLLVNDTQNQTDIHMMSVPSFLMKLILVFSLLLFAAPGYGQSSINYQDLRTSLFFKTGNDHPEERLKTVIEARGLQSEAKSFLAAMKSLENGEMYGEYQGELFFAKCLSKYRSAIYKRRSAESNERQLSKEENSIKNATSNYERNIYVTRYNNTLERYDKSIDAANEAINLYNDCKDSELIREKRVKSKVESLSKKLESEIRSYQQALSTGASQPASAGNSEYLGSKETEKKTLRTSTGGHEYSEDKVINSIFDPAVIQDKDLVKWVDDYGIFKLIDLAEGNDMVAQRRVARYYETKNINLKLMAYWYEEAAKQGDYRAQVGIAKAYQKGKGTFQDDERALKWYLAAMKQEPYTKATAVWGLIDLKGMEWANDTRRQFYLLEAPNGNPLIQYRLAVFYENGYGGIKKSPDSLEEAVYWYKEAANQGFVGAERALERLGR